MKSHNLFVAKRDVDAKTRFPRERDALRDAHGDLLIIFEGSIVELTYKNTDWAWLETGDHSTCVSSEVLSWDFMPLEGENT